MILKTPRFEIDMLARVLFVKGAADNQTEASEGWSWTICAFYCQYHVCVKVTYFHGVPNTESIKSAFGGVELCIV